MFNFNPDYPELTKVKQHFFFMILFVNKLYCIEAQLLVSNRSSG
jgi:hypothetical protein